MALNEIMRIPTDVYVDGNLHSKSRSYPAGSIGNAAIAENAGLSPQKLDHEHRKHYAIESATISPSASISLHTVIGAQGIIRAFRVGNIVKAVGDATCTVNLKKNGTTVLSAVITLNSSSPNYTPVAGAITDPGVVAGDVLEATLVSTAGSGTLPKGVYCELSVIETYA